MISQSASSDFFTASQRAARIESTLKRQLCTQDDVRSTPGWSTDALQVEWHGRTGSTNADGLRWLRARTPGMRHLLCGALHQDAGRGRAGRAWLNDAGTQLMMSLATLQHLPPALLPALSLVAGVTACEAIEPLIAPTQRHRLQVKWPNDLLWDEAKLAGILLESTSEANSHSAAGDMTALGIVLGIGLNLEGGPALSQRLARPIADWSQISATAAEDGDAVLIELAQRITRAWLRAFDELRQQGLAPFLERLSRRDALRGLTVMVSDGAGVVLQGEADGIDTRGCLRLRLADGAVQRICVGDVQVKVQNSQRGDPP